MIVTQPESTQPMNLHTLRHVLLLCLTVLVLIRVRSKKRLHVRVPVSCTCSAFPPTWLRTRAQPNIPMFSILQRGPTEHAHIA